jgi:two-component system, OmpR family, sensor kinase
MAVLLIALGLFLHLRLESQLDDAIDQGLLTRADEVAARIGESSIGPRTGDLDASPSSVSEDDESFVQVLTPDGRVVESTGQLDGAAAVGASTLATAADGPAFVELASLPGLEDPFRALAAPVENREGSPLIAVVGASLDDRDEALSNLTALLLVGGPISLLLASLAGYAAIGAALRPVEAMRVGADAISAGDPAQRLPAGSADDELSRLAETLNAMLARLQAGLERERRFVDDASHELRTPLALHKTELEIALRYEDEEEAGSLRAAVAA